MKGLPVISLIGRPNVGKSTIFNALMGQAKRAITYDTPGVTRDRHYGIAKFDELKDISKNEGILVDTGGFYPAEVEEETTSFFNIMADHAKQAIEESELVLFVVDVREGLLPFDASILEYIRAQKKDCWLLINKYDSDKQMGDEAEFYSLGIDQDDMFIISAEHRLGFSELKVRLQSYLFQKSDCAADLQKGVTPKEDVVASLAIVGSPNAGKSTLLNQLIGASRALVSDVPGTTVDPIEGYFDLYLGKNVGQIVGEEDSNYWRSVRLVDTAGIRKQRSINNDIEAQSVFRALRSITQADIVVFMVDATKGVGHQDRRLIEIALEKGKSLIICLNKFDLVQKSFTNDKDKKEWLLDIRDKIPWLSFCDLIPISAKYNKHIKALKDSISKTIAIRKRVISTGELNRFVAGLVERNPVVVKKSGGKRLKIKYASMIKSTPPTFILFSNRSKGIADNYRRYLINAIRSEFGFVNTPIHLIFRTQSELEERKATRK